MPWIVKNGKLTDVDYEEKRVDPDTGTVSYWRNTKPSTTVEKTKALMAPKTTGPVQAPSKTNSRIEARTIKPITVPSTRKSAGGLITSEMWDTYNRNLKLNEDIQKQAKESRATASDLLSIDRDLTTAEKQRARNLLSDYDLSRQFGGENYMSTDPEMENLRRRMNPVSTKINDFLKGANPFAWAANTVDYVGNLGVKTAQDASEAIGAKGASEFLSQFDPTSQSTATQLFNAQRQQGQEGFKQGLGTVGQIAADVAFSGADMAGKAAASVATGIPFLALSAADAGAQQGQKALNEGYSAVDSAALALGSGAINAGIESFGGIAGTWGGKLLNALGRSKAGSAILQRLPQTAINYITRAANSAGGQIARSALSEGAEEFTENGAQLFLENLLLNKDTPFDVKEALYQAGVGAITGGIFGGGNVALNALSNRAQSQFDPNSEEMRRAILNELTLSKPLQETYEPQTDNLIRDYKFQQMPDLLRDFAVANPIGSGYNQNRGDFDGRTDPRRSDGGAEPVGAGSGNVDVLRGQGNTTGNQRVFRQPVVEDSELGYGKNTVGAAESGGRPTTEQLLEEYGAFPQGEQPRARDVQIPKASREGPTSRFARTAAESAVVNDEVVNEIQKEIADGTFSYTPISDKRAVDRANERIEGRNLNELVNEFEGIFHSDKRITKYDIAFGERLIQEATAAGDYETATRLIADVAAAGTEAGQAVQAMRILKRLTPEGNLMVLQRAVDRINSDRRRGQDPVYIPEENQIDILSQTTQEGLQDSVERATKAVADQMPATWVDKWNAWRYMAMLTNPGTHLRNITGNLIFSPVRKFKNIIGAGLEAKFSPNNRTKAILSRFSDADKSLLDFAKKDYDEVYKQISQGKRNPKDMIRDQRQIFNNRILETARKKNSRLLELEDSVFSKEAYADSLAQFMKANGLKPEDFAAHGSESKIAAKAREYAVKEAQKATYQDASALANALSKVSRSSKAASILTEGILPFKKTPINVLKRGVEYSPLGLVKSLTYDLYRVHKGDLTASQAIDSIASGLSGTGVMILGGFLASQGLLVGGAADNKKEQSFNEMQGEQTYSLKIGPYTYTIDWAAPSSIPLFVGAELYQQLTDEDGMSFAEVADSMTKITDPMFEMSMLDGLNDTIRMAGYSANPISDILVNTISDYFGQAAPTLTGRIARTTDPTRRSTYIDKNSWVPQLAQSFMQNVQGKIPDLIPGEDPLERFTSKGKQPYLDAWGREDVSNSTFGRIAENFLSPGYVAEDRGTTADDLLSELYLETGDASILPSKPQKYITIDKQRVDLTGDQYTEYTKTRGQLSNQLVEDLVENSAFDSLSGADKSKVIGEIYDYADAIGKAAVSDYELDGWILDAQTAQDQGIPLDDFFVVRNYKNGLSPIKNEKGETEESTTDQFRDFLLGSDQFTPKEKSLLDELLIGSDTVADYSSPENFAFSLLSEAKQEAYSDVERLGISKSQFSEYEDILSGIKSDKNARGKTISGSLKRNRINALVAAGVPKQEAVRYVNARY